MVLKGRGRVSNRDGNCYVCVPNDLSVDSRWFFGENEEVLVELHSEDQTLVIRKMPNEEIEGVRDKLKFYCPRCEEDAKPPLDSKLLYAVSNGSKPLGDASYFLRISHYRHKHTDYEEEARAVKRKYEELGRTDGFFDHDSYGVELDQIRIFANERARELLEEDGLIIRVERRREFQGQDG